MDARLKEHAKMHKGGMRSKHMKNMVKFIKEGDSFEKAHKKAMKEDSKEVAEIDGEKIEFKPGALRQQLGVPKEHTFKKMELRKLLKVENGEKFMFMGKEKKMTPLLKKRINFALVLMKGKK